METQDLTAALHVEPWPISDVKPYPQNARRISSLAVDKVAASLKEFGWRQPIVVDSAGVIVAGHTRHAAAVRLGLTEVPVHVAAGLSAEQIRLYRLADNRTGEETKWDERLLGVEMKELAGLGADLSLAGFAGIELDKILGGGHRGDQRADRELALNADVVSRLGDVWILGAHRLGCGDSTDQASVQAVLQKARPRLMVTDPPYGVDYDPGWRDDQVKSGQINRYSNNALGDVKNDSRADWSAAFTLFPGDVVYAWHASLHTVEAAGALEAAGFQVRAAIIWVKQHLVLSRGHYHWLHEPCWYSVRKGGKASWRGDRKQTTVWNVPNLNPMGRTGKEKATGHGTQKPIELMRRPMLNHLEKGGLVYDAFMGSGSTLIAAEECGRVALGLDIDPRYIDLAVRRWEEFTGRKATLEASGAGFEETKAARREPARKKAGKKRA